MTIRDDVINFQLNNRCNGKLNKRLLVRVPVAITETFNVSANLDIFDAGLYTSDDSSNYIYLRIFPVYDTENDQLGEVQFKNTFSRSAVFAPSNTRRGFKATVKDNRKVIFDIVRRLIDISESSGFNTYSPIKIIDFCCPELKFDSDTFTYNDELATVRYGLINIDSYPSTIKDNYLNKEWSFSFKEAKLRLN
jgi:hypothetical protein